MSSLRAYLMPRNVLSPAQIISCSNPHENPVRYISRHSSIISYWKTSALNHYLLPRAHSNPKGYFHQFCCTYKANIFPLDSKNAAILTSYFKRLSDCLQIGLFVLYAIFYEITSHHRPAYYVIELNDESSYFH